MISFSIKKGFMPNGKGVSITYDENGQLTPLTDIWGLSETSCQELYRVLARIKSELIDY